MTSPRQINGGGDEWYTPRKYIEAASAVMGGIDLDPTSNEIAAQWIPAAQYFTREDDGLSHEWFGRVWLNPPYSQPLISQFLGKLADSFRAGKVTEAIALTHNNTDSRWWQATAAEATVICFTRGRIAFEKVDGAKKSPTQGQTFFYFGVNSVRFIEVFQPIGIVLNK
jgi:phage N-6-adenine-methyltransferase